nr:MAG TPA: hypothetical protein [Herelleviridae sp.]
MAETAKVFNGLRFVTALPETASIEKNVIYFVRTNEGKTDGYLYFNGKKYGTAEDAKAALVAKYGDLKIAAAEGGEKEVTIPEYVKSVLDAGAVTLEVQDSDKYLGVTSATTEGKGTVYTLASKADAIEGAITSAVDGAKTAIIGTVDDAATADTINGAKKAAAEAKAAADTAKTTADGKVASVNVAGAIVKTGEATTPTIALKLAETQGNVVLSQDNGLKANIDLSAFGVKGVTAGEKVISVSTDGLLSSTLSLKYDSATKKINLYGKAEDETNLISAIDATDFIKDGMLEKAELVTNPEGQKEGTYIVLTWNTAAGKEAMPIDVSSLIDTYTAKADGGLVLEDHAFSVDTAKIATVESVNGVADRVTTLEGKVGSAAVEGGAAATGLFKETADNKAAIDKLNGADNVEGSVDYKIKTALDKGAVTLQVKDNDAYLGVTSATTENGTVYTLASKETEINNAIKTAADAVKVSVTNGTYVKGSVDEAGRAITLSETVQKVETSSADAKGLAEASDVKAYVDGKVSGKNVTAEGESGETALVTASAADNKVTVNATDKLKNAVAKAETSVQSVNGKHGAAVTLTGADIATDQKVGESTTATVNTVLADIYTKLGVAVKADGKTIKEAADHTLSVNLEATSDALVQAGHIEIKQNTDGALYGVMYCLGDDAE